MADSGKHGARAGGRAGGRGEEDKVAWGPLAAA